MQTYQSTPDFYRDYIEHANHKYIDKHMGKNGKWIYTYAKSHNPYVMMDDAATKIGNKISGAVNNIKKNATVKNIKKGLTTAAAIQKNNENKIKKKVKKYKPKKGQVDKILRIASPKYDLIRSGQELGNSLKKKKKK